MPQTVSLSLFRFDSPFARAWAMGMMALARRPLAKTPDIEFWKLCGSGIGEGFTPTSIPSVIAILAVWPDTKTAKERIKYASVFQRYRNRSQEDWSVFLTPQTARGEWSGQSPFRPEAGGSDGPLAALTRATIRPSILRRFWKRVPDISAKIGQDQNVAFKIGIGEVPMLHQVTFSIWPDEAAMANFARTGAHADAIHAVRKEGWFREELYARFQIQSDLGSWGGSSPLRKLEAT